jgi:hypothetical protein
VRRCAAIGLLLLAVLATLALVVTIPPRPATRAPRPARRVVLDHYHHEAR